MQDSGNNNNKNESGNSELPALGLSFDPTTLKVIEESKIKKIIGPLIANAFATNVHKIGVLSWDDEASTRYMAQLLAVSFAQQLGKKCAFVVIEGIRFNTDVFDSFNLITLPEVNSPDPAVAEKIKNLREELDRTYPFQVVVGSSMNSWERFGSKDIDILKKTDAQILVVPETGLKLSALKAIQGISSKNKIKWLGSIELARVNQYA